MHQFRDNRMRCPIGNRTREREWNEMTKVRIRRLTPKECWRLMDFPDEAYEKAAQVNSNTQLYKQAGNSIVVACLEHIFRNLFNEQTDEPIEEEIEQTLTLDETIEELSLWDLIDD